MKHNKSKSNLKIQKKTKKHEYIYRLSELGLDEIVHHMVKILCKSIEAEVKIYMKDTESYRKSQKRLDMGIREIYGKEVRLSLAKTLDQIRSEILSTKQSSFIKINELVPEHIQYLDSWPRFKIFLNINNDFEDKKILGPYDF